MTEHIRSPSVAISVQQPWADAVLLFGKDFENRVWCLPPKYRNRPVWLHAGKKPDRLALDYLQRPDIYHRTDDVYGPLGEIPLPTPDRYGAVVGAVMFDSCQHLADGDDQWDHVDLLESAWWHGPHGWHITWAVPLFNPVPYRGRLRFFKVDLERPDFDKHRWRLPL